MDKDLNDVLKKILSMPQDQRAFLVDKLIDSLDVKTDLDVEIAWQREIRNRIEESENGNISFISWENAKYKLSEH